MRIFVFFDTKEYSSDHYKDNLTRKLYSFVYNQVGKPMLLNVERAPMNGRTTSKSDENWSNSLYLLNAEDSAGQDEILAKMYSWSEIPGQQAPPEKLILNVLKKELPKNDHSTRHASATGRIRASSKANNVKKPTTASPLPLPSMMHTADQPSISVPPTETALKSTLPHEPIRTNTSLNSGTSTFNNTYIFWSLLWFLSYLSFRDNVILYSSNNIFLRHCIGEVNCPNVRYVYCWHYLGYVVK
jgi:hypothetical protein